MRTIKPGMAAAELVEPGGLIGYRRDGRPIHLQAGGSRDGEILVGDDDDPDDDPRSSRGGGGDPDDDDDEDEDGDPESLDEPDDETDGDDGTPEWTPPTQEDYEEMQRRLRRASGEAASRKRFLRAHGIDPKTGQKADPDGADAGDAESAGEQPAEEGDGGQEGKKTSPQQAVVRRAEERGAARVMAKLMPVLAVNAVETALRRASWKGTNLDLVMRMIDLDDVDVEDGRVVGVDEQIEQVRAEFPDWFEAPKKATKATTRRTAADVDGGRKTTQRQPERKSWVEQVDSAWAGTSGRQR